MSRNRVSWAIGVLAIAGACKKKQDEASPSGDKGSAAVAPLPPPKKLDGPSVTPLTSQTIAFVVPKRDAKWWGEMNFACYRSVMSLTGSRAAGDAFEKLSPNVPIAMAAGEIDLGRDLAAIGMFDCGDTPCLYVAATLTKPEKMPDVLGKLVPGAPVKTLTPGHYTVDTPGAAGTRTIHVRVTPVQWASVPTGDAWNVEVARATHVVFIGGVDGKNADIDPLTKLADPQTAAANVKDVEGVLGDARGRCILGRVGPTDFQPGYKLDGARFALAAPPGKGDPLMALLDSKRTVDVTVELVLTPAPKEADVQVWVARGRAYAGSLAAPLKMQFAGNPMLDVYFDMMALLGERGFKYELDGKALRFSWRTDRVPASELAALEKRFQAAQGTQP
ncbi:MAG TPA: hypothetical protein VK427_07955 [Kofleriaceae bacterium]|nr:hypothetical protein [Kofleriaceae bacterium]